MPVILTTLLGNWRLLAAGCLALGLLGAGLYVAHLRAANADLTARAATLQASNDELARVNAANEEARKRELADKDAAIAALTADRDAQAALHTTLDPLRSLLDHAQPQDDAPLAPDLKQLLDGLRGPPIATPAR